MLPKTSPAIIVDWIMRRKRAFHYNSARYKIRTEHSHKARLNRYCDAAKSVLQVWEAK